jgi:D-alanyl-lipoteichoic acid acyltransferase DltB (MBOAT superfamily)
MTLLLFAVTASNYFAARALVRWPDWKDRILGMVVALSIVNLSVFKYFSWFASEIGPKLFSQEMSEQFATWHIVLPLGLSFYTFHNLAYTIDVYRGRFELRTDPIDYFLYGSYFPQLVAGPVERPQNVLPQLEQPRRFDRERLLSGFGLALWGAFKKVVLADAISPYVDLMFLAEHPSWAMVWSGALGFTIQALIDFSGYTDIARGTSRMLGIELMDNFAHPYLSATPMEFWQRWHISFSTWLRDYVYMPACFSDGVRRWVTIPFTGDWGPFANTSRALLITMLVSGLWHGSTMNFIVWGFYYFVIGTIYAAIVNNLPKKLKKQSQWRWLTVPIMFCLTVFGMHIFRQPSLSLFWEHLWLSPFEGTQAQWVVSTSMLGLCGFAALPLIAALIFERQLKKRLEGTFIFPALQTTTWAIWAVAIFISVRTTAADFIYFQF